ncbi:DUF1510 family protein [Paenalkalicoccus suaedae]|uniref:DUF1510 family protein n=1 Tax=Paenalkalicoccus suaedae TaxID=2592382 RepID=A0A859FBS0_9BACI|nr:DUF1510 family protein [Paenalkalicoccus suaedae]QKS70803.1 DUF1510 family protein [Paenalkalicoccus suaedae]
MNNNEPRFRRGDRKKGKFDLILNISIGLVALLIVVVGGTLIFGGGSNDTAGSANTNVASNDVSSDSDNSTITGDISVDNGSNSTSESNTNNVGSNNSGNAEVPEVDENISENENNIANENNNEVNNTNIAELDGSESGGPEGEWSPIGTVQEEPFSAVYDQGHVNWSEMTRALVYATGLSQDEMTIWRIENGGNERRAVGYVSTGAEANTPYRVEMEFVANEGWMPQSVERLSSNPHR